MRSLVRYFNLLVAQFGLAALAFGCSGAAIQHETSFERALDSSGVKRLWSERMTGLISDLNLSGNGGTLVVATVPDHENPSDPPGYRLTRIDGEGDEAWSRPLPSQVKAQAVSDDGSLIVVALYDDTILAFGAEGNPLWKAEGSCRPIPLDRSRRVVCFHDDDGKPGVAFDALSWEGIRLSTFEIDPEKEDVLQIKASKDRAHFAIALTGGTVLLFDDSPKPVLRRKFGGEIVDLAVSSGDGPLLAALTHGADRGQGLTVVRANGAEVWSSRLEGQFHQIEISAAGDSIFAYGNNPRGQSLARYEIGTGSKPAWFRTDGRYADYTTLISVTSDAVVLGFEDDITTERHTHLVAFDRMGKIRWNIPFATQEGAYFYSHSIAESRSLVVVATDDGRLTAYQVQ